MTIWMLYDSVEAQIVGFYSTREKAEKRRDKVIESHTNKWFFNTGWYDPSSVEITEITLDEDWDW